VTVLVTGTANDQLTAFDIGFQNITLTSQSGKTVTLLSASNSIGAEFMHINGTAEPLVTASIPQGVYTSASITFAGSQFTCTALGPVQGQQSLSSATYQYSGPFPAIANVTFSTPLTISGDSAYLLLDLLVSQSATIGNCLNVDGFYGFSITPNFSLSPLTVSSSQTNTVNGKVLGVDGEITAIASGSTGFTLSIPNVDGARPVSVTSDSNTVYQNISDFSALRAGMFVDMDGDIEPNGSVLATRVAVEDPSAGDVLRGPLIEVASSVSIVNIYAQDWQGKDVAGFGGAGSFPFNYSGALFQISGQFTNLDSLPFVPSFSAANMVTGQEAYISAASMADTGYPTATTITLMPQTIDGTVTASSTAGDFTDYTVSLASYDLFPMLASQPSQTAIENNPSQVEVYVDSNTQQLNTQALASGGTFRFYGLVFNDDGTLRMDCAQVNDGVPFTPQANSASQIRAGYVQTIRQQSAGGLQLITTTVTHSR
jgi:hypothetical protein